MNIEEILQTARSTWGDDKLSREEIVIALGVVYGDICRLTRDSNEKGALNEAEMKKELGNIICSTIRWCDDLGFKTEGCIKLAQTAQKKYVGK